MFAEPFSTPGHVFVIRWVARIWALAMFLLWGAFFLEHLKWFVDPRGWPPPFVFALMSLHFLLLVGLLLGWKWELLGAGLTLSSAIVFFSFAAGANAPVFILITAMPALLWLYCAWRGRGPAIKVLPPILPLV